RRALPHRPGEHSARRGFGRVPGVIGGGATRPASPRRAIAALGDEECDVLFHDAARPLVEQRIIADCISALAENRAIGVAVPASDTIVEGSGGPGGGTPPPQAAAPRPPP